MRKIIMILVLTLFIINVQAKTDNLEHSKINFWKDGYFVQNNIKILSDDHISVKIDNKWENYTLMPLPDKFIKWSVERRLQTLEDIKTGKMPSFAGPHNGIVASYGIKRNDSQFMINNAVKGMGYTPKKEKIDEVIKMLKDTKENNFQSKLKILEYLYTNIDTFFDREKLLSLELYSTKEFETGTFLNQMAYPKVAIVFLDIPSFEVKSIPHLLHPDNPDLNKYEKDIVEYVNLIHSYFHGKFSKMFIAVIYNVIEVYDNSPKSEARGRRIVPPLP
jgi:hypothetical protein